MVALNAAADVYRLTGDRPFASIELRQPDAPVGAPNGAGARGAGDGHDVAVWVLFEITRDEHRARVG